jgi:hypothetical protein
MIHELVGIRDNTAVLTSAKVPEQYRCGRCTAQLHPMQLTCCREANFMPKVARYSISMVCFVVFSVLYSVRV